MPQQNPSGLPWLDRMAVRIPGYGGYHERGLRRSTDKALRDAIGSRLNHLKSRVEQAIRVCTDSQALTEIGPLERARAHLERVIRRVESAGSGTDDFYGAGNLHPEKADPLHALDHELYSRAETMTTHFEGPDLDHDLLAHLEKELKDFEAKLDERALSIKRIS